MRTLASICMTFRGGVLDTVRSRIFFAFRVFAAIYDYRVVEPDAGPAEICVVYGDETRGERGAREFAIPGFYRMRTPETPPPAPVKHVYGNQTLFLFYGIDPATGHPDWLGEIFEWISSSTELHITERDEVGRIPFSETVFEKFRISPRKPYATLLMGWMDNCIRNGRGSEAFSRARSPIPGTEHVVVCSHDIDFYSFSKRATFRRLVKNLAISSALHPNWSYFSSSLKLMWELLSGRQVGDFLPAVVLAAFDDVHFQSTLFVVPRHSHGRDPDYDLDDLLPRLGEAVKKGFSVGLHGSYGSIAGDGRLAPEARILKEATGRKPLGSRQHWLRFDRHKKLFDAIEEAELVFDSTLGFSETVGFRNGASFAFPPYDFDNERPHSFLEIPLVLMDESLQTSSRLRNENAQELADEVLNESRRWSWGGVSALWHNPVEALQVPEGINQVFWNCVKKQTENAEKWMSAEQFMAQSLKRYQNAGLLEGVRLDA